MAIFGAATERTKFALNFYFVPLLSSLESCLLPFLLFMLDLVEAGFDLICVNLYCLLSIFLIHLPVSFRNNHHLDYTTKDWGHQRMLLWPTALRQYERRQLRAPGPGSSHKPPLGCRGSGWLSTYTFHLDFWRLCLRVFVGFYCVWSSLNLCEPGRNTDVTSEAALQFLQAM
jgi:hypothetical protein